MKEKQLVIYGTGSHAQIALAYFEKDSPYKVVAFTVEEEFRDKEELFGLPVLRFQDIEKKIDPSSAYFHVAVGPLKLNSLIEEYCVSAKLKGYTLVSYFPSRSMSYFQPEYGENCFFDHATLFHPYTKVGNGVVLYNTQLGHNVEIKDFCFITSSVLSGNVTVEDHVFIGVGAIIREGVVIGRGSIIGMGSVIKKDVEPYSVCSVMGTQSRTDLDSKQIELFRR